MTQLFIRAPLAAPVLVVDLPLYMLWLAYWHEESRPIDAAGITTTVVLAVLSLFGICWLAWRHPIDLSSLDKAIKVRRSALLIMLGFLVVFFLLLLVVGSIKG
jgi:hypothetical protein